MTSWVLLAAKISIVELSSSAFFCMQQMDVDNPGSHVDYFIPEVAQNVSF